MKRHRLFSLLLVLALTISSLVPAASLAAPPALATNDLLVTFPGNYAEPAGLGSNWDPGNLNTQAADVPEGNWEYKVALNESWDVAYPSSNKLFSVPAGGATVVFSYDSATNAVSEQVLSDVPDEDLVRDAIQVPAQDEVFYFALTDRFANGDPSNDEGAAPGGTMAETGFLPEDKAFYHGGDLSGLTGKLDYLQDMGITAIWITPVLKNKPTQPDGTTAFGSALPTTATGSWTSRMPTPTWVPTPSCRPSLTMPIVAT